MTRWTQLFKNLGKSAIKEVCESSLGRKKFVTRRLEYILP
jgi:hypothetical protein